VPWGSGAGLREIIEDRYLFDELLQLLVGNELAKLGLELFNYRVDLADFTIDSRIKHLEAIQLELIVELEKREGGEADVKAALERAYSQR
jgi:hypothetical protein